MYMEVLSALIVSHCLTCITIEAQVLINSQQMLAFLLYYHLLLRGLVL